MLELLDIVTAFTSLAAAGKAAALATVIGVDGSSYRRPGAKMLIAEDGRTWGGVSGGCLERDVVRNAIGVMATGRPIVVRYDTTDDEQLAPAASTGCGGAVEIFIQPATREQPGVLAAMATVLRDRLPRSVATIVRAADCTRVGMSSNSLCGESPDLHVQRAATSVVDSSDREALSSTTEVAAWMLDRLHTAFDETHVPTTVNGRTARITTGAADRSTDWFVETIRPPQSLVIFGAGPDVAPIVSIARTLGWQTTVVATPPATHVAGRFADVDRLLITPPSAPARGVPIADDAAVLIMTHSVARDAAILAALADRNATPAYLGLLGPRHRTEKLLGDVPNLNDARVFSPIGLDLGAETPEEIALAVMAEIQAALRHASAEPLRDKVGPIHATPPVAIAAEQPLDLVT